MWAYISGTCQKLGARAVGEQPFRSPQKDSGNNMNIPANSSPGYWLAEGFLGQRT